MMIIIKKWKKKERKKKNYPHNQPPTPPPTAEFAYDYNCRMYTFFYYERSITNLSKFQLDIAFYLETKHYWVICTEKHG